MDRQRDGAAGELPAVLRKRSDLLEALADGPRDQRDLRDALGVSRSTVYKALTELEAADLVVERDGEYALTGVGRLAWRRHDAYAARLEALSGAAPLLEAMPADRRLPLALFEHGRTVLPGRHAPEEPLERLEERAETADRIRVASPAGMPRYFADIHDRAETGTQTTTLVLERAALEHLREAYDRFEAALSTDGVRVSVLEAELPFAVVLFDEASLGLFAYEGGSLAGAVYSSDPAALAWGESFFDRHLAAADPAATLPGLAGRREP